MERGKKLLVFLSIFILFCIFIIGALFGSFFSLATYRIPRGEDIICTRSYCPNCKHKLSFFDLFPVISYIACLGKCRYCKEKISPRYILLESLNGLLFVGIFLLIYFITYNPILTLALSMAFYILYAIIFVIIGSKIMKCKMNKEEKINIKSKKGVYVAELIVAFIIFLILVSSSVVISRNYSVGLENTRINTNIVQATQHKLELLKQKNYDDGYNSIIDETSNFIYNGETYSCVVEVEKYIDMKNVKYDLIKVVTVKLATNDSKNLNYELSDYVINYSLL